MFLMNTPSLYGSAINNEILLRSVNIKLLEQTEWRRMQPIGIHYLNY